MDSHKDTSHLNGDSDGKNAGSVGPFEDISNSEAGNVPNPSPEVLKPPAKKAAKLSDLSTRVQGISSFAKSTASAMVRAGRGSIDSAATEEPKNFVPLRRRLSHHDWSKKSLIYREVARKSASKTTSTFTHTKGKSSRFRLANEGIVVAPTNQRSPTKKIRAGYALRHATKKPLTEATRKVRKSLFGGKTFMKPVVQEFSVSRGQSFGVVEGFAVGNPGDYMSRALAAGCDGFPRIGRLAEIPYELMEGKWKVSIEDQYGLPKRLGPLMDHAHDLAGIRIVFRHTSCRLGHLTLKRSRSIGNGSDPDSPAKATPSRVIVVTPHQTNLPSEISDAFIGSLTVVAFDGFTSTQDQAEGSSKLVKRILGSALHAIQKVSDWTKLPDLIPISSLKSQGIHAKSNIGATFVRGIPPTGKSYRTLLALDERQGKAVAMDIVFQKTHPRSSLDSSISETTTIPLTQGTLKLHNETNEPVKLDDKVDLVLKATQYQGRVKEKSGSFSLSSGPTTRTETPPRYLNKAASESQKTENDSSLFLPTSEKESTPFTGNISEVEAKGTIFTPRSDKESSTFTGQNGQAESSDDEDGECGNPWDDHDEVVPPHREAPETPPVTSTNVVTEGIHHSGSTARVNIDYDLAMEEGFADDKGMEVQDENTERTWDSLWHIAVTLPVLLILFMSLYAIYRDVMGEQEHTEVVYASNQSISSSFLAHGEEDWHQTCYAIPESKASTSYPIETDTDKTSSLGYSSILSILFLPALGFFGRR